MQITVTLFFLVWSICVQFGGTNGVLPDAQGRALLTYTTLGVSEFGTAQVTL
jgi:hypothetical protein